MNTPGRPSAEAIKRFSDVEVHEDEPLKCYMNCLFHEFGMVDDAGEAHFEKILNRLPDSVQKVAGQMLAKCEHPQGANLCERAFWLHSCFKGADPVVSGGPSIRKCVTLIDVFLLGVPQHICSIISYFESATWTRTHHSIDNTWQATMYSGIK